MITINVIQRTFQIQYGQSTGTCFTVDISNKQYFVTAKHVIADLKDGDSIELFYNQTWSPFKVRLIGHSVNADVSVFAISAHIAAHPVSATMDKLSYGQDLYFLGFPFGLKSEIGELNRNFPLPLVKRGIVSALFPKRDSISFLIDGHNNPGFSGGPVVFSNDGGRQYSFAGIISGYHMVLEKTLLDGKPTLIETQTNTGIIIAYSIKHALELIDSNPVGVPIYGA